MCKIVTCHHLLSLMSSPYQIFSASLFLASLWKCLRLWFPNCSAAGCSLCLSVSLEIRELCTDAFQSFFTKINCLLWPKTRKQHFLLLLLKLEATDPAACSLMSTQQSFLSVKCVLSTENTPEWFLGRRVTRQEMQRSFIVNGLSRMPDEASYLSVKTFFYAACLIT